MVLTIVVMRDPDALVTTVEIGAGDTLTVEIDGVDALTVMVVEIDDAQSVALGQASDVTLATDEETRSPTAGAANA